MTSEEIQDRLAIKDVVDTFSNLADEKRVADQMPLFTEDAQMTTYIGGEVFADVRGRDAIEKVFSDYLANFHTVYHLNGQLSLTFTGKNSAEGITYCFVQLLSGEKGKIMQLSQSVRYNYTYQKIGGKWLIAKRVAHFIVSENRPLIA